MDAGDGKSHEAECNEVLTRRFSFVFIGKHWADMKPLEVRHVITHIKRIAVGERTNVLLRDSSQTSRSTVATNEELLSTNDTLHSTLW